MSINIGDGVVRILGDTAPVDRKIAGIGDKTKRAGTQATRGLKPMNAVLRGIIKLAGAVGVAFLAWKAVAIFRNMIRAAGEFQRTMNRVRALTQATGADFDKLRAKAAELGRTTQFTATQVGEGMAFLAQAGFNVNEIYGAMEDTLNLAAAAQLDLATAADIVSNVMAGFGIQSTELTGAVDVLTKSFISANTDLRQLGDAMKLGGPVAKAFGLTFEETAATLSLMGNAGFQGTMAGTALRGALVRLGAQGKKFGLQIKDTTTGALKPFADIMDEVTRKGLDADEIMKLFGQRAGPAMLALLEQGSGALRLFTEELNLAGGTTKKIADIQMEGLHGAIKRLQSAWEALQIALADTGFLDNITRAADAIARFVREVALSVEEEERVREITAEINKEFEEKGFIQKWLALGSSQKTAADSAAEYVRTSIDMAKVQARFNDLMADFIRQKAADAFRRLREAMEETRAEQLALERAAAKAAKAAAARREAGVKTIAALQKEAKEARELSLVLIDAGASAFELNQAVDKLNAAEKALAEAQKEVLGGFKELKGEVKAVASEIVEHDAKLPPLIEKYNSLKEALRTLGIEGSAALKEQLTAAESALEAIRVAVELGLASNVDILAGEIEVMEIRTELWRALGQTIDESYLQKLEEAKEKLAELRGEGETDLTALGKTYETVTGVISNALGQAIQAAILGQRSLGAALKQTLAEELSVMAKRAVIKAIMSIADAIRALAMGNFASAGKFFLAAAKYGAVAAAAGIAARAFAQPAQVTSEVGGERRVFTTPTAEEQKPLIVERRLAMGGLITRPTLAMLGERGPEMVVPLRQGGGGVGGSAADRDGGAVGTAIQIFIEGMISPDVLDDVIQQISERVEGSDVRLSSTSSLRVISRS